MRQFLSLPCHPPLEALAADGKGIQPGMTRQDVFHRRHSQIPFPALRAAGQIDVPLG